MYTRVGEMINYLFIYTLSNRVVLLQICSDHVLPHFLSNFYMLDGIYSVKIMHPSLHQSLPKNAEFPERFVVVFIMPPTILLRTDTRRLKK